MDKLWNGRFRWLKRIVIVAVLLGIIGGMALFVLNWVVRSSVEDDVYFGENYASLGTVDCILVLGAGVRDDGTPSPMLKDRLDRALELYAAGVSDRLLMSGDHGRSGYNEVQVMKQYAIDAGVPADRIFMDHAGFSTYESMVRARDVFQVENAVIVTQKYHMYRALYGAKKLGITATGVPAADIRYRNYYQLEVREILARAKEFFWLLVQPEPAYLGESIPVSGDGNATNDGTAFHEPQSFSAE